MRSLQACDAKAIARHFDNKLGLYLQPLSTGTVTHGDTLTRLSHHE